MRQAPLLAVVLALSACGGERDDPALRVDAAPPMEPSAAIAAVQRGRCVVCHELPAPAGDSVLSLPRIPLRDAAAFWAGDRLASFLSAHHAGEDAVAIAAHLRSQQGADAALRIAEVGSGAIEKGQQLFSELGCAACHRESDMASLAERTDHAHVAAFLRSPADRRPDLAHDFGLSGGESTALAAHLLRAQASNADAAPAPGLDCECFELDVRGDELPQLDGLQPTAKGVTEVVDVRLRTRDDRFALRFSGLLLVPESGQWTFTLGSDDSSWLWIDDALVVENAKVAPHRRKSGKVTLAAGSHRVRIVFTEIGGQESLEFLWRGPSGAEEIVPASALARRSTTLTPRNASVATAVVDDALRTRGKEAYAARRCSACHTLGMDDDASRARIAKPWSQLEPRACAVDPRGAATFVQARAALASPVAASVAVAASLESLQCTSCHARDGRGGMNDDARQRLAEVEDLGDEGRVPPDLSRAGHRLRRAWIEGLLQGENRIRGYMKARMPKLSPELAQRIAEQFERADAKPLDDQEPPFDAALVAHGQQLVGVTGRNCVTCHPFGGRRAIGPQGMDLALQTQRLKPAWFGEWLLHATRLRPGTRMPSFWLADDASSRRDVDAIRVWSSLGDAAPVPKGYRSEGAGLLLDPVDRPILHGAFLKDLSARCVAVGSPLRGHYAYDVEHASLAWLWRGDFLDAAGTWSGRAGQLLEPSSKDRVTLDALVVRDASGSSSATPLSIGQRRTKDGYPTFRGRVGEAEFDDTTVPEFTASGIAFVRTIRCERGRIRLEASPSSGGAKVTIDGAPASVRELGQGESVTLRYEF